MFSSTGLSSLSRGPRVQHFDAVGLHIFVGCSALLHGLATVLLGPIIYPDSARYAPINGNFPPMDLLGTYGNAAPLVQLVWRLPSPLPLIVQAAASGVAWAFVSSIGIATIHSRRWAVGWVAVVTAIFWTPVVVFADAAILTESLAIAGSVACTAGAISLANERARKNLPLRRLYIFTVIGFGVAVLSRPVTLVGLGPIIIASLLFARRKSPLSLSLISAVMVIVMSTYAMVMSANAMQSPNEVYRAYNRLAHRASPAWIEAAERTGFNDCPDLPSSQLISGAEASYTWFSVGYFRFRQSARGPDKEAAEILRRTNCPGIIEWLKAGHLSPLEQLIYVPRESMNNYLADVPRFWLERSMGAGMDLRIQRASPLVTLLLNLIAVILLIVTFIRTWRLRRAISLSKPTWIVVGIGSFSWFCYSVAVWLSDDSALGRIFLPVPIIFGPAALLVAALTWTDRDPAETNPRLDRDN